MLEKRNVQIDNDLISLIETINNRFNDYDASPKYNEPYEIDGFVVVFWVSGAIALRDTFVYFIGEDDGHWFADVGTCSMSSSWLPQYITALAIANSYIWRYGEPYGFRYNEQDGSISETGFCGLKLNIEND